MRTKKFLLVAFFVMVMLAMAAYTEDNPRKISLPGTSVSQQATQGIPAPCPKFLEKLPKAGEQYYPKQPITKYLKKIIDDNHYVPAFESAINRVSNQNIPELDMIATLDQFYFYLDELVKWKPELRIWVWKNNILHERTDYLRITQFYYYFNQPELEALQNPIEPNKEEKLTPISSWLRDFAVAWGAFLDTPESKGCIESYRYAPEYALQDYVHPDPKDYKTFNEYFSREFRDINVQRPIAQPENDRVIVFPAESTFVGQWTITTEIKEPYKALPSIVVKHVEWPIKELLKDSVYAKDFEGGILCHSFLNVYDYHRLHTPVKGKVLEAKIIPAQVYLEVTLEELTNEQEEEVNPNLARAVIPQRYLDAKDSTGYQFVQCRGLLVLDSPIGKVAVLPIGMAQVSSVVFVNPQKNNEPIVLTPQEKKDKTYLEQVELLNKKIKAALVDKTIILEKGAMFSYFQFGGSDCVMVFERQANVDVTAKADTHYPIRSQYAISNIKKLLSK